MAGKSHREITSHQGRIFVLFWDGAIPWIVENLLAEGALPHLESLIKRGIQAEYSLAPEPNCETPPGFATLVTGSEEKVHQIFGYKVPSTPPEEHTVLEWETGFNPRNLRATPFWIPLAKRGIKIALSHIPFSYPLLPFGLTPEEVAHITSFNGYEGQVSYDRVLRPGEASGEEPQKAIWKGLGEGLEFEFRDPLIERVFLFYSHERNEPALAVRTEQKEQFVLSTSQPEQVVTLGENRGCYIHLFDLALRAGDFCLWRTGIWDLLGNKEELVAPFMEKAGPFLGMASFNGYFRGQMGHALHLGGRGQGDTNLARAIDEVGRYFTRASEGALDLVEDWQLSMHYQPCIDSAEHIWLGYLDKDCSLYDEENHDFYWETLARSYRTADEHLGKLLRRASPEDAVILLSDHGQSGTGKAVYINYHLAQAGLLTLEGDGGEVDLSRTRAIYSPSSCGYIIVNTKNYQGGIVEKKDIPQVLEEVKRALDTIQCPDREINPVREILTSEELFDGAPGQLFLVPERDYIFSSSLDAESLFGRPSLTGYHRERHPFKSRQAIFFAGGGPFGQGKIGPIDNRDLASIVCHLFGVSPPEGASGQVREELWQNQG